MINVRILAKIDGVETSEDREELASALILFLRTRCNSDYISVGVYDTERRGPETTITDIQRR